MKFGENTSEKQRIETMEQRTLSENDQDRRRLHFWALGSL